MLLPRPRIRRGRGGELRLRLPDEERELLLMLCEELRGRVGEDRAHPDLRRLFPPAHPDDENAEDEYRRLLGSQLDVGRERALVTVEATVGQPTLTTDEAESWLRVLNDLRLVLGTRLDVTEDLAWNLDPNDPRTPELAVYAYLSWLQEQLVEALASGLS
jgi:Domain of unknown function (DUF2017)